MKYFRKHSLLCLFFPSFHCSHSASSTPYGKALWSFYTYTRPFFSTFFFQHPLLPLCFQPSLLLFLLLRCPYHTNAFFLGRTIRDFSLRAQEPTVPLGQASCQPFSIKTRQKQKKAMLTLRAVAPHFTFWHSLLAWRSTARFGLVQTCFLALSRLRCRWRQGRWQSNDRLFVLVLTCQPVCLSPASMLYFPLTLVDRWRQNLKHIFQKNIALPKLQ